MATLLAVIGLRVRLVQSEVAQQSVQFGLDVVANMVGQIVNAVTRGLTSGSASIQARNSIGLPIADHPS